MREVNSEESSILTILINDKKKKCWEHYINFEQTEITLSETERKENNWKVWEIESIMNENDLLKMIENDYKYHE